ncbi:MAG: SIMPL domain-containing protein [Micromonosporaceae bacterium]
MLSLRWLHSVGLYVLAPLISAPLAAQTPPSVESTTVVVTAGRGEVRLPPDYARIKFAVASREASAAAASAANARRLEHLVDTLKRSVGPHDSVQVVTLNVGTAEDWQQRQIVGYDARASVVVTLRDLTRLQRVLDVGFADGVTLSSQDGVTFWSDRARAARQQALAQAFDDARSQAEALAHAAGLTLGPLVQVTTQFDEPRGAATSALGAETAIVRSGAISLSTSDVMVLAAVQVSWRLRPRAP